MSDILLCTVTVVVSRIAKGLLLPCFCMQHRIIELKFLLSGHTYMQVDSMHAAIEYQTRPATVWAPSEWRTLITNARRQPTPYKVEWLKYSDIINWKLVEANLQLSKARDQEKACQVVCCEAAEGTCSCGCCIHIRYFILLFADTSSCYSFFPTSPYVDTRRCFAFSLFPVLNK